MLYKNMLKSRCEKRWLKPIARISIDYNKDYSFEKSLAIPCLQLKKKKKSSTNKYFTMIHHSSKPSKPWTNIVDNKKSRKN